jgi:spermidine synthase
VHPTSNRESRRLPVAAFVVAIFLNAFLLFLLEPLFGKMVLPHLGGTAAVWTTCVLFFQLALVCGYVYSHLIATLFGVRMQLIVHLGLTLAAVLVLPVSIPSNWSPSNTSQPEVSLIGLLSMRIGAPFLILAAGSPLIQHWFSRARGTEHRDPYALYVASNLGSFAALLAYPFAVEPWMTLTDQTRRWAVGYIVLVVLTLACGLMAARGGEPGAQSTVPTDQVPWRDRIKWILLAAVPSSLMLGVTTHITTDLAPIPLLWILPLALYLLTFVIAFGPGRAKLTKVVQSVLPYVVIAIAILLAFRGEAPGPAGYMVHAVALFFCALAGHLRLAESRPSVAHLTEFYVWLAIGGAMGGFFNVAIAPNAFHTVVEYPLALLAAVALSRTATPRWRATDVILPALLALGLIGAVTIATRWVSAPSPLTLGLILGAGGTVAFALRARPVGLALSLAAILSAGGQLTAAQGVTRFAQRSFYGVYRVVDDETTKTRRFYSGTMIHGSERLGDTSETPLTYYHRDGPLGALFAARTWRPSPWRVGVIGLGTGATAAYARADERWTFFEIDPLVARVAEDTTLFRFLSSARVRPRIILGDARLSIKHESRHAFDVLVVDAFSSDAIPMHLLTREALALYRSRLAPDGVVAWHISNRYLDLRPVLEGLAKDAGLNALIRDDSQIPEKSGGRLPSTWVVMTADDRTCASIGLDERWTPLRSGRRPQLWTDDFSNVLSVVR